MDNKYLSGIGIISWDPDPYIDIQDYDNCRYITFNGNRSTDFGLIMADETPISYVLPKRTSITMPFCHGTVDVSPRKSSTSSPYGNLYFENRKIEYIFDLLIPRDQTGLDARSNIDPNRSIKSAIERIKNWVGFMDETTVGYQPARVVGRLSDSALTAMAEYYNVEESVAYTNAKCTALEVSKQILNQELWALSVRMTFECDPEISNIPNAGNPSVIFSPEEDLRYIEFNGQLSKDLGLVMSNETPIPNNPVQNMTVDNPMKNGVIDKSFPFGFPYLDDKEISYEFKIIFNKEGFSNNLFNGLIQLQCEKVLFWLFNCIYHQSKSFVEHGTTQIVTMYGTSDLRDSYLPNQYYSFARCTGLSLSKQLLNGAWVLNVTPTITMFPLKWSFSN